jgi:hypothetical protein
MVTPARTECPEPCRSEIENCLAEYPHQPGDYESADEARQKVQHLEAGPLVISFWPDSFARVLRITESDEL